MVASTAASVTHTSGPGFWRNVFRVSCGLVEGATPHFPFTERFGGSGGGGGSPGGGGVLMADALPVWNRS
jgi:hypothetical protein